LLKRLLSSRAIYEDARRIRLANIQNLGSQERAVLDRLIANPFIGQQELANVLGLARSTIAAHIVQLMRKGFVLGRGYVMAQGKRIVCVGGATVDHKYHAAAPLIPGTSNPARGQRSLGGVARNVAENLARLGVATSLVTIVGDDENGRAILRHLRDIGVDTSQTISTVERPTAEYAAILDPQGSLAIGVADMDIFDLFTAAHIERIWPHLAVASWVFADCNLPADTLAGLIARKQGARFSLAIDAVSMPKGQRLPEDLSGIDLLFLNRGEARAVLGADLTPTKAATALRARGVQIVVLTLGAKGCVVATEQVARPVPSIRAHLVDVTGAGDAMISGTLYGMLAGERPLAAARTGTLLASMTVESEATVHPNLSAQFLAGAMHRIAGAAE
jgi:pseudouridine kinase